MRVKLRKSGPGAVVEIPCDIIAAANLTIGSDVEIVAQSGGVVITRPGNVFGDLPRLLAGITADNRHDEVSFGGPVGKELL